MNVKLFEDAKHLIIHFTLFMTNRLTHLSKPGDDVQII